jgi:hypothetical protein
MSADIDVDALEARIERCADRVVDALDRIVTELRRMNAPDHSSADPEFWRAMRKGNAGPGN